MSCSFPGEESIRIRAENAHCDGGKEYDDHHPACPCREAQDNGEEVDEDDCRCDDLYAEDEEEDRAQRELDALESRYGL